MSSFLLKIVAIITMAIDHIGLAFFSNDLIFRKIGRIAMPIFAFQVGVGFKKTHSKLKYIFRMFCAALISEISFLLMLRSVNYQTFSLNICFTFTLALITLYFVDLGKKNKIFYIASIISFVISAFIPMDYGIYGVALVLCSYFFQDNKTKLTFSSLSIALFYYWFENSSIQLYMLLALPFLLLYNGKKGKDLKYLFYAFYPLHMLIIALLKIYI